MSFENISAIMNKGESRKITESTLHVVASLLYYCKPRPKFGRLPGPATQKTISCPGDQAQGHREGQSIKPLPFECNLNAAGGRAKYAAARAAPGRRACQAELRLSWLGVRDSWARTIQLFTTSDAWPSEMHRQNGYGTVAWLRLWRLNFILYDN